MLPAIEATKMRKVIQKLHIFFFSFRNFLTICVIALIDHGGEKKKKYKHNFLLN